MEGPCSVSCDRCVEHEARIEVLMDELYDALSQIRAFNQALTAGHPSVRRDDCPPHGIKRPKLTVVR
jgi:hypothetical protein